MQKDGDKWLSMYIFYKGNANSLLKQAVHPVIQQWRTPWFFIRYWEDGDHIRLRLKAAVDRYELIIDELNFQVNKVLGAKEFDKIRIQIAEYEPEINRYGNTESIIWAERYFECSSVYTLNWLAKKVDQSVAIQAVKLHLTLLFSLKWDNNALINICNFFLEGWLPKLFNQKEPKEEQKIFWLNQFQSAFEPTKSQVVQAANQFWKTLSTGGIDSDLADYLTGSAEVMNLYKCSVFKRDKLIEVVCSFMHMNNNRLGISNYEEAYIMYCIITCLQFINENSTHLV